MLWYDNALVQEKGILMIFCYEADNINDEVSALHLIHGATIILSTQTHEECRKANKVQIKSKLYLQNDLPGYSYFSQVHIHKTLACLELSH
jgi:hypothetical protein